MYVKLTKVETIDGRECVTCAFFGTERCRVHSGCHDCEVMGAILNQLHAFEEIYAEAEEENQLTPKEKEELS